MIAHHTISGCPMKVGDLLGSGTISGPDGGSEGSMLEQCRNGMKPIMLASGELRYFLQDGDTVTLRGWCGNDADDGNFVGFGECTATVLPALSRSI